MKNLTEDIKFLPPALCLTFCCMLALTCITSYNGLLSICLALIIAFAVIGAWEQLSYKNRPGDSIVSSYFIGILLILVLTGANQLPVFGFLHLSTIGLFAGVAIVITGHHTVRA